MKQTKSNNWSPLYVLRLNRAREFEKINILEVLENE